MKFNFNIYDIWESENTGAYYEEYRRDLDINNKIEKLESEFRKIKESYDLRIEDENVENLINRLKEIRKEYVKEKERLNSLDINKL